MSIKVGRAHGNGYHDSVVRKITVKLSKGSNDLLEYELSQLKQNGNVIYERDYCASFIKRICVRCPISFKDGEREYMEKRGEVYVCDRCGLIKVPKGIKYEPRENRNDNEEKQEYVMCPECSMYFARLHEESGVYYCEFCNHEFEHVEMVGLL